MMIDWLILCHVKLACSVLAKNSNVDTPYSGDGAEELL